MSEKKTKYRGFRGGKKQKIIGEKYKRNNNKAKNKRNFKNFIFLNKS
jgi:hypothetical protein